MSIGGPQPVQIGRTSVREKGLYPSALMYLQAIPRSPTKQLITN